MDPNFENFNKRGEPGKKIGVGETKKGEKIFKVKGGEPNFKSNLGIEKDKNGES